MFRRKEFWLNFLKRSLLAVISVYLIFLFIEIFIPLNHFENPLPLQQFTIAVHAAAVLVPYWFICLPLQAAAVLYFYQQYFPIQETGRKWLEVQYEQLSRALTQFLKGELAVFPTNAGLILLLILIALGAYLLINRKQPTLIILTCFIYLMILHVFTPFDYFQEVIKTAVFSILLLGIAQVPIRNGWRAALLSFFTVALFGFFVTQTALWAVDHLIPQRQWVENQSRGLQQALERNGFFDWIDHYTSGGGLQRMGYGEDDSRLGGPLQQDFQPVFAAYDDEPHYWRISVKEIYTGQGWEQMGGAYSVPAEDIWPELPDSEPADILVKQTDTFSYYPYTYETYGMKMGSGRLEMEFPSEKISQSGMAEETNEYSLLVVPPEIDEAALQEASFSEEELADKGIYFSLPGNIPDRVWQLAEEITRGKETDYEKVRAIESYLHFEAGLRYSLREAAYLPEGEEYVDHFLFESRVGYCDNFSTAMVVLARMNGIPARWAKGFNSGTPSLDQNGERYYQITNANAHSWPEIYFPGFGWLPFEPTPAFYQPATDRDNLSATAGQPEDDVLPTPENQLPQPEEAERLPEREQEEEPLPEASDAENAPGDKEETAEPSGQEKPFDEKVLLLLSVLILLVLYLFRKKLFPLLVQVLLTLHSLPPSFKSNLIWRLFQMKLPKEPGETVRQYFEKAAGLLPAYQKSIREYIQLHEKLMYAPEPERRAINEEESAAVYQQMLQAYRSLS